jgi:Amt family ammonium transporter
MLIFTQTWGALAAAAWCASRLSPSPGLLERVIKLRAHEEDEVTGLDVALHGESA